MFLCAYVCVDSSSPQISAIFVGHFAVENDSLRKSPRFSGDLRKTIIYKSPGSSLRRQRARAQPVFGACGAVVGRRVARTPIAVDGCLLVDGAKHLSCNP